MNIPRHIAIILDGNGRWAQSHGMPRTYGHIRGCANLETVVDEALDLGVKYLTVYAFSTENWKRSKDEVEALMKLFRSYLKKCIRVAVHNQIRIRVIGETTAFSKEIQQNIAELEEVSKDYDRMVFQIALNYGGRDELTRAMRQMAREAAAGTLSPEEIDEAKISGYLDTGGIPDPDLLIRTSGEKRISNFLLWQLAYTELYFTDVPWPEFDREQLICAIEHYNNRDRRFGGVKKKDE